MSSKAKTPRGGRGNGTKSSGARAGKPAATDGKRRRGRPPRAQADGAPGAFPGERLIHRYGNRRFYDLAQSRPLTLDEIGELVRQRHKVRVLDVERGNADITRRVLTQILLDGEQLDAVPVEFLRRLIVPFEKLTASWIRNYLTKGLDLLERAERQSKPDGDSQSASPKMIVELTPPIDYRQRMAKADITRQIEELRRKLDDI